MRFAGVAGDAAQADHAAGFTLVAHLEVALRARLQVRQERTRRRRGR